MRTYHVLLGFVITALLFSLFLRLPPFSDTQQSQRFVFVAIPFAIMAIGNWAAWRLDVGSPLLLIGPIWRIAIFLGIIVFFISSFNEEDIVISLMMGVIAQLAMFLYFIFAGMAKQGLIKLFFPKLSGYIITDN